MVGPIKELLLTMADALQEDIRAMIEDTKIWRRENAEGEYCRPSRGS